MRDLKNILIFALLIVATTALAMYRIKFVPYAIGGVFLIHLFLRKKTWAYGYLSSPLNIFTSKRTFEKEYDMSASILYDKMKEVIPASRFKLFYKDPERCLLFATSSMTWFSWGENLYINIIDRGDKSTMKLTSVGFFQLSYSFGKNEQNYNRLMSQFEESLII